MSIHAAALLTAISSMFPSFKRKIETDAVSITGMTFTLAAIFGGSLAEAMDEALAIDTIKSKIISQSEDNSASCLKTSGVFSFIITVIIIEAAGWAIAHRLNKQ